MKNSGVIKFELRGMDEIRNVLKTLPTVLQDKVLRQAVGRAAGPLVQAAKMFARRSLRTGALVESIGAIVKKGKKGAGVYAVIGARRGYYRGGSPVPKGGNFRGADNPANYAHLIEYGHHVVAPKKNTSRRKKTAQPAKTGKTWVTGKAFMRPALLAAGDAIETELAEGVREGIERQLKRLVKSPKAFR